MNDLKAWLGTWQRGLGVNRFNAPNPNEQVIDNYTVPTELIEDLIKRNVSQFKTYTLDLSVAGEVNLVAPGFHIVIYGHDGTPNKAVNTSAYVEVHFERKQPYAGFPMKHGRGFSGPFRDSFLKWPAQPGVFADVVVFTGMHKPWIGGDSAT